MESLAFVSTILRYLYRNNQRDQSEMPDSVKKKGNDRLQIQQSDYRGRKGTKEAASVLVVFIRLNGRYTGIYCHLLYFLVILCNFPYFLNST